MAIRVLGLKDLQSLRNTCTCGRVLANEQSLELRSIVLTIVLELLHSGNHFAIKLSRSWMGRRAVTRSVVVLQVLGVRAVSYSPLRALLNREKAERAVALP